jgi:hypothetical protein
MTAVLTRAVGDTGRCIHCGRQVERGSSPVSPWRDLTGANICPQGGAHAVEAHQRKP